MKDLYKKSEDDMVKKTFNALLILGISGFTLSTIGWYTVRYISTQKAYQNLYAGQMAS